MIPDLKTFTLLAATLVHMDLFAKGCGWIWSEDFKARCTAGLRMLPVHTVASLSTTRSLWRLDAVQYLPPPPPPQHLSLGNWKCVCEELHHSPLATASEVGELEGLLPVLREPRRQLLDKGVYQGYTGIACHGIPAIRP